MTLRGWMRDSLRAATWVRVEKRGRLTTSAWGNSARTMGAIVAEPSSIVSSRPRACSSRSVKMWPRSRSAHSCTSSTATKATSSLTGIASTVHRRQRAFFGSMRSSPVISATLPAPLMAQTLS